MDGGKYPYLRMNNITYGGELDLSDTKRIDIPDNELDKCTVRRGDVLFNRTNSKELVGKTCVYNRDDMMVLAGFVIRVRVSERILPEFLSEFLNTEFSKQMLLAMCKTARTATEVCSVQRTDRQIKSCRTESVGRSTATVRQPDAEIFRIKARDELWIQYGLSQNTSSACQR